MSLLTEKPLSRSTCSVLSVTCWTTPDRAIDGRSAAEATSFEMAGSRPEESSSVATAVRAEQVNRLQSTSPNLVREFPMSMEKIGGIVVVVFIFLAIVVAVSTTPKNLSMGSHPAIDRQLQW